jgi:hypothetical protein
MRNSKWKVEPVMVTGSTTSKIGYRVARVRDGQYEVLAEETMWPGHPARFLDRAKANMIMAADRANVKRKVSQK